MIVYNLTSQRTGNAVANQFEIYVAGKTVFSELSIHYLLDPGEPENPT